MIKRRRESIYEYCKNCRPDKHPKSCEMSDCPLWVYRSSSVPVPKDVLKDRNITRQLQIRKECMTCCNGSASEVRQCHISDCALHPYRGSKGE